MKYFLPILIFSLLSFIGLSQEKIDGDFSFQTDPAKKYSLYIPSEYDATTPNKLMLGLHPFNTNRWDGEAWRDTLTFFAEENNLILVCPDGGVDGQIDSQIDTAFTTALLDSVSMWYNIDESQKYVMGFSWGGKTTYTYGLRRTNEFSGYLVIGAAVQLSEVNSIISNAKDENFYLLHGSQDNPSVRYTPLLNALNDNDACTNSMLLNGVGHTIDFPNRNQLLTDAFNWLQTNECNPISHTEENQVKNELWVYPNPNNGQFLLDTDLINIKDISINDLNGRVIEFSRKDNHIQITQAQTGVYFLRLAFTDKTRIIKLSVY